MIKVLIVPFMLVALCGYSMEINERGRERSFIPSGTATIDALPEVRVSVDFQQSDAFMFIFHSMYTSLCEVGIGSKIFLYCERKAPGFESLYDEWLAKHPKKIKAVNQSS